MTTTPLDKPVRLTLGNLKGGSGRSTSGVFLALALARQTGQKVLLVDADKQNGTTYEWSEDAGDALPELVSVVYWPSLSFAKRVREHGHDGHVIIDTPNDAAILRQAFMVTDALIIPLAPTGNDVARLTPTFEAAAEVGMNRELGLGVVLSKAINGTKSRKLARKASRIWATRCLTLKSRAKSAMRERLAQPPAILETTPPCSQKS
ncbi:ParA family protein [Rathayibacter rathayi]|uniref:ParA family protein n=1 Tax=Rathayibacter rathayi TaxID=33887 RepID=UPI000CE76EA7|nr:ParA family protein [Rathayibacter rathayi]PPH29278.1 chromosome partitioning protein ParA [Rathayibacter rathayi]